MTWRLNRDSVVQSVAITLVIQITVSFQQMVVPVMAPAIAAAEGWNPEFIGFYTPLVYGAAWAISLPCGRLIDWAGPLGISLLCLAVAALGLGVMAGGALPLLAVGSVLIGLGYGPVTPASSAILSGAVPPRLAGLIFSIKQTGVPAGGVLAGLAIPLLLEGRSWQATLGLLAGLTVLVALVCLPARRTFDRESRAGGRAAGPRQALRLITANPPLRAIVIASMAFAAMQASLTAFLVTVLVDRVGLDLIAAGRVLGAALGASVVARIGWGVLADRLLGPRPTLVIVAAVMAASAVAVGRFDGRTPAWVLWPVALAFGATAMGWNGVILSEVVRLAPAGQAGAATGASMVFTFGGVLIGPILFTQLLLLTGDYRASFSLVATFAIAAAVMLIVTRPRVAPS